MKWGWRTRAAADVAMSAFWLGGFNLLPYRQREARRARRRCLREWLVAACCGGMAAAGVAGWQVFGQSRIEARQAAQVASLAALAGPLAEHARLVEAKRERGLREKRARAIAVVPARWRALLEGLSREAVGGVRVRRIRLDAERAELVAEARDAATAAAWTKRLEGLDGVGTAEVGELKRLPGKEPAAGLRGSGLPPLSFTAVLRWSGGPLGVAGGAS